LHSQSDVKDLAWAEGLRGAVGIAIPACRRVWRVWRVGVGTGEGSVYNLLEEEAKEALVALPR
jgi:hypothetical protein